MEETAVKLRNMTSIYIQKEDCLLLLYRIGSRVVEPSWCGIGGHFEKEELNRPDLCILRELQEETGLLPEDITSPKLRYITFRQKNEEIRQNYYFFARLKRMDFVPPPCEEGLLKWVPVAQAFTLEMPFTARCVLTHYFETGQHDSMLYAGIAQPAGTCFTPLQEF